MSETGKTGKKWKSRFVWPVKFTAAWKGEPPGSASAAAPAAGKMPAESREPGAADGAAKRGKGRGSTVRKSRKAGGKTGRAVKRGKGAQKGKKKKPAKKGSKKKGKGKASKKKGRARPGSRKRGAKGMPVRRKRKPKEKAGKRGHAKERSRGRSKKPPGKKRKRRKKTIAQRRHAAAVKAWQTRRRHLRERLKTLEQEMQKTEAMRSAIQKLKDELSESRRKRSDFIEREIAKRQVVERAAAAGMEELRRIARSIETEVRNSVMRMPSPVAGISYEMVRGEAQTIDEEIEQTKKMIKSLEIEFYKRKISEEEFKKRFFEYQEKLRELEEKKKVIEKRKLKAGKEGIGAKPEAGDVAAQFAAGAPGGMPAGRLGFATGKRGIAQKGKGFGARGTGMGGIPPEAGEGIPSQAAGALQAAGAPEGAVQKAERRGAARGAGIAAAGGAVQLGTLGTVLKERAVGGVDEERLRALEGRAKELMQKYGIPLPDMLSAVRGIGGVGGEKVLESFSKLIGLIEERKKLGPEIMPAPVETVAPKEVLGRRKKLKPVAFGIIRQSIVTDFDSVLAVVRAEGRVKSADLSKKLNMDKQHVADVLGILEEHGLVKMHYPAIGGVVAFDINYTKPKKKKDDKKKGGGKKA